MKVLMLCLIIISVLLPNTGQRLLSGAHQHASMSMMATADAAEQDSMNCHHDKKLNPQMMEHDCCDDSDGTSSHQCSQNCDECSDCMSSGLAILAQDIMLQHFHHADIVRSNPQLPISPIQNQVIPPIS